MAAKTVRDLIAEDGYIYAYRDNNPNAYMFELRLGGRGGPEDGHLRVLWRGACNSWEVMNVFARRGWGPLLHDIAMEWAGSKGLVPDRMSITPKEAAIWDHYLKHRRGDVEWQDLGSEADVDVDYCRLHNDDDHEALDFRFFSKRKTTIPMLKREGRWIEERPRRMNHATRAQVATALRAAAAVLATGRVRVRKPYGEAKRIIFSTELGEALQDAGAHTEMVTDFVSDHSDPLDGIITNFDLNGLTWEEREVVQKELLEGTQKSLRARGLPSRFSVYRYGPIRSLFPDVTAVTLNPIVAWAGARRTKQDVYRYEVDRDDVLVDVDALWPAGFLVEEELLVNPRGLKRREALTQEAARSWGTGPRESL